MSTSENNPQDPDALLNLIKKEEEKAAGGNLRIFFGMCAGVGKTYAMLEAAKNAKTAGVDVVAGVIETHRRAETEELLVGLSLIPRKAIEYRGAHFSEMDIDAIIARRPALVLVDELAHSNIPGSRHMKRYQDVLELLKNGIDVYTTLNVQHLESRCETVRQITGVPVRETVPDSILEQAEIELIDLTPDELLKRLKEGKVYTLDKTKQSIENFFRKGNLIVLREMALRVTAERVDKDVQNYKADKRIDESWRAMPKLLVAVSASPFSADLIRWTRRLAYSMEAPWIAVHIETDKKIDRELHESLLKNINLARELGAEIISVQDTDIVSGLLRVANANNVTQILMGKPRKGPMKLLTSGKRVINRLLRESGDIGIYVVGGERETRKSEWRELFTPPGSSFAKYFLSITIITLLSIFLYPIRGQIGYETVSLIFLFVILLMPLLNFGPGPIMAAALLSAYNWDFFFIPPQFTLRIERAEDIMMFAMYFVVAAVSGYFTSRIRAQKVLLDRREKRTSALYDISKDLSSASSMDEVVEVAVRHLGKTFDAKAAVILFQNSERLSAQPHIASTFAMNDAEWNVAQWTFMHSQKAGRFTNTLPLTEATYYPIKTKSGTLGVIGLSLGSKDKITIDLELLFESFFSQICVAIERECLNDLAKKTIVTMETEKLYRTLFDSLSHELKTPITAIKGAVESLEDPGIAANKEAFTGLIKEIGIAANRLNRLVENLLDMARLESGNLKLKREWHLLGDILDAAVGTVAHDLRGHTIQVDGEDTDKTISCDFTLIEQALINILRNAIDHTPEGSAIVIKPRLTEDAVLISISDNGPGFPPQNIPRLFEKFFRLPGTKAGGTGIGLSIAKGFIEAHGGSVSAANRAEGGAEFLILLPYDFQKVKNG